MEIECFVCDKKCIFDTKYKYGKNLCISCEDKMLKGLRIEREKNLFVSSDEKMIQDLYMEIKKNSGCIGLLIQQYELNEKI